MDCRSSQPRTPTGEAMSRYVLFVLLLTTTVALAEGQSKSQKPGSDTSADTKTEATQEGAEQEQVKMQAPAAKTKESQTKTEDAQGKSDDAQPKKEEPVGQTGGAPPK